LLAGNRCGRCVVGWHVQLGTDAALGSGTRFWSAAVVAGVASCWQAVVPGGKLLAGACCFIFWGWSRAGWGRVLWLQTREEDESDRHERVRGSCRGLAGCAPRLLVQTPADAGEMHRVFVQLVWSGFVFRVYEMCAESRSMVWVSLTRAVGGSVRD
jgi:hypothetical protein